MRLIAAFSVFAIIQQSGVALAGVAEGLAPHRAVYDIELADVSERSRIESMFGRMVYEFSGSPCEGYTVDFRFVSQLDMGASVRVTDQQTQTYEDIENASFSFMTRTYINDKLDKEVSGNAALEGDATSVRLKLPEPDDLVLAASEFPTAQMITLIEKAKAGESFFQSRLYDGTEEGREVMLTSNIVGSPRLVEDDEEADAIGSLKDDPVWPVSVAYFDEVEQGDGVPIYRISFKLHENGVTRDLVMDYGEFTLTGKLTSLEVFDSESCE
ncbi:MAG: ATP-binding protein [Rhizobiaceae bacterium MnEN-MB40S]|nr:MAG: ATP-binding protein [Rhizobiaceae bacterium MnEN-MB40S]